MDVDQTVLSIIREMARIPAAIKTWKTPVAELLNDNRLFNCSADTAQHWKPIIRTLFDADKTAFPELLCMINPFRHRQAIINCVLISQSSHCTFR